MMEHKKVFVCGYFDGLHPGHIRFLKKASQLGKLVVGVGSDERLRNVKGTSSIFNQDERVQMVSGCKYVERAFLLAEVAGQCGVVWEAEIAQEKPDYFVVNDDLPQEWLVAQSKVCRRHGVEIVIQNRDVGSKPRSSSQLRSLAYPYRICLTTGMDQVQLSSIEKGVCIGASVEADQDFADRSGMATSTRNALMTAFGGRGLPSHLDYETLAKVGFAIDNPPMNPTGITSTFPFGSFAPRYITGSIDPIALIYPGITRCEYDGGPWPKIVNEVNEEMLLWLEERVSLVQLPPRPPGEHFRLDPRPNLVQQFARSTYEVWDALQSLSLLQLKKSIKKACLLFGEICPTSMENGVADCIATLQRCGIATCVQGSGTGGYIACFDEDPADRLRIRLRRKTNESFSNVL